ncbi:MAG: hypothetical protein M0Z63_01515 [Actinomycetota bacterium]|jgi:hypothetical protein|nr:hypothetical protein [Actinomycetota bacterium]
MTSTVMAAEVVDTSGRALVGPTSTTDDLADGRQSVDQTPAWTWAGATLVGAADRPDIADLAVHVDRRGLALAPPALAPGGQVRWRTLRWTTVLSIAVRSATIGRIGTPEPARTPDTVGTPGTPGTAPTGAARTPSTAGTSGTAPVAGAGTVVLIRTDRATYRLRLPEVAPAAVATALQRFAPDGLMTGPTRPVSGSPSTSLHRVDGAPRRGRPRAPDALGYQASVADSDASSRSAEQELAEEPTGGDAARPAIASRTAPSTFVRIRPVLTAVLVLAVATMVALVLADSVGAIHLTWLGGTGASSPSAAPFHLR